MRCVSAAPFTRSIASCARSPLPCARPPSTATFSRFQAYHAQRRAYSAAPLERQPAQTLTEKIVQRYAVGLPEGKRVRSGDYISLAPEKVMSHDNSWPIASKFMSL